MQNYQNNYQDQLGNAIPGASVTVRQYPSNVLATIYSDNGVTPLPNPTTTDSLGMFLFYAANGSYSVQCTKAGFATQTFTNIQLFDTANVTTLNTLNITSTTDSTSTVTGALTVAGGVGVAKNLYVGGSVNGVIGAGTPAAGSFTTLSTSGAYSPSQTAGIVGTTTNNNANAGSIGEYVSSTAGPTSITNATITNLTSISLTAGDWDVIGNVDYAVQAGDTMTGANTGISTTSATNPAVPLFARSGAISQGSGNDYTQVAPMQRLSLSATTTVYLVVTVFHSGGVTNATGIIRARRVR